MLSENTLNLSNQRLNLFPRPLTLNRWHSRRTRNWRLMSLFCAWLHDCTYFSYFTHYFSCTEIIFYVNGTIIKYVIMNKHKMFDIITSRSEHFEAILPIHLQMFYTEEENKWQWCFKKVEYDYVWNIKIWEWMNSTLNLYSDIVSGDDQYDYVGCFYAPRITKQHLSCRKKRL